MPSYKISEFNPDNLASALSNKFTSVDEVKAKNHFTYLIEYLGKEKGIKAGTILIEYEYISRDFLVDYTSYYASCFDDYKKKCKRIHFFENTFTDQEFENFIVQPTGEQEDFWKHYLGFIVAKPIPVKVIGTTVLKTYPKSESASERIYFGNRSYIVNLFGNKIKLESLAFQEQDTVVGVCASTAIWSMLHKASCNSYAILKTPSEITNDADIVGIHGERMFPNKGLSINQIAKVIYHSGLVSEIITGKKDGEKEKLKNAYVKRIIEAYAPVEIPLIFILSVPYITPASEDVKYDYHAVTVTGYKFAEVEAEQPKEEISWRSDRITKIFVHDDRWGPYARLEFGTAEYRLDSNWSKALKTKNATTLTDIIIPVHHKIRISYDDVELVIKALDQILWLIFKKNLKFNISWKITINYSERFKESTKKTYRDPKSVLLTPMPKYVWVADAYVGNKLAFQILFDATDLAIGMYGFAMYFYDEKFRDAFHTTLEGNPGFKEFFAHPSKEQFYNFFLEHSAPPKLFKGGSMHFDLRL
ncbi:MAG: hypothetical protein JWO92_677 [Chitinophagaceae bacterium]|nr:hypothetical protein [Chitinophagaceae bacterium]MDB5222390.1 hypothetical protein [Chitinophagaceae bacterium]